MKLKKLIKIYTPSPDVATNSSLLRYASKFLLGQNIWYLNRRSVAGAVFIGIFCAMLPIPMQMLLASVMALILRAHLPLSFALTWITNPLTYAPIFYFNYRVGLFITGESRDITHHTFEITAFFENFYSVLLPVMIGSVLCGLFFGGAGYIAVRLYWRLHVVQTWDRRKIRHRFKRRLREHHKEMKARSAQKEKRQGLQDSQDSQDQQDGTNMIVTDEYDENGNPIETRHPIDDQHRPR